MVENKHTILVVDDTPENIDVLRGILHPKYRIKAAISGERALKVARSEPQPDMILLDVMMPGMDGYEVCRRLKQDPLTADIPVIFVTAKDSVQDETHGLEIGAIDYITKPVRPAIVKIRVQTHLALRDQTDHLENLVQQRTSELNQSRLEIIRRLGQAAEYKDNETGLHIIRMSHYSKLIASALGKSEEWAELIFQAAPMHDVGKIGVPDALLQKPGKLTPEEWQTMKRHPEFGAEIIGEHQSQLLFTAREIALSHHERWDGSGYPHGLTGYNIPLSGRVVAIADVFDALTSNRPYKDAWSNEDAIAHVQQNAGSHFDPELVAAFTSVLPQILEIRRKYAD
ncbi:two-component system response regulator [uncultured Ferrimonas sp.]|uniref:HD-GYP domain-containing protein n=1 Tax=uncultured Ferrimonas sp. TaxID=432640 RepID=UPI0026025466|nr:two-component system response regulator [uncultured Ferrimonas sp.]